MVGFSAQAIDVSLSGTAKVTFGTTSSTSTKAEVLGLRNTFGADTTIAASASGELDNGWTVSAFMDDIANGMTSAAVTIGMGSAGSFRVNQAATGAADGYDDVLPVAMEETNDQAKHSVQGMDMGSSVEGGSLSWIAPALEAGGATIQVVADYDPAAGAAAAAGSGVASGSNMGQGMAIAAKISFAGLSLYGGHETVETKRPSSKNAAIGTSNDKTSAMGQVTYAAGPLSVGYGEWYTNELNGGGDYSTEAYSIAFAVNDDLSISYGNMEDTKEAISATAAVVAEMESYQMSYSMGGMAISAQHTKTDNGYFDSNTSSDNTEIAISFSF